MTLARALDDAIARHRAGAEWLLLLDLDGTLADFKVDPKKVRLFPGIRPAIRKILDKPRARVVVVTGRRALEARDVLRLDLPVSGLHGREFFDGRRLRIERVPTRALRALTRLEKIAREIAARTEGARHEDKRPGGVVLHVRGARPHVAKAAEAEFVREILAHAGDGIEWMTGKRMAEARVGGVTKGTAVAALAREAIARARKAGRPRPFILFAGDDVTDEDAFRVLEPLDALTVLVARRPRATAARVRVPSIGAVRALLDALAC